MLFPDFRNDLRSPLSRKRTAVNAVAFALLPLLTAGITATSARAQVSVLTHHNDNSRTGANNKETILTPAKVNSQTFGKLFAIPADGEIYAQPLYVSNVTIPGKGKRNVIYFATMNNSVYAHDADTGERLWCQTFGPPVPAPEVQICCADISRSVGILGTPVIDPTTNRIYFVSRNKNNDGSFHQFLNALDITTGTPTADSPREIGAQAQGLTFDPRIQNQRPAITLSNGTIYIAWASHNDGFDYHGWIMAYRASDLTQKAVYVNTPGDGEKGGIWMAGSGLAVDSNGNVYASSGNGTFRSNGSATGNSYTKLSSNLSLLDWFTPFDSDDMNAADADLGSCGLLAIPGTQLLLGGSKNGVFYLVDSKNMGHFHSTGDQVVQEFQAIFGSGTSHIHGSPIYYNSPSHGPTIFVWGENDVLRAFAFNSQTQRINPTPYATSKMTAPMSNAFGAMPGGFLSVTSNNNASQTGIVWASTPYDANANNQVVHGVLHAFNAETLQEVWSDKTNAVRDEIGRFAKYCSPTVANGKVYIPNFGPLGAPDGSGQLVVYGLLPSPGLSVDCGGTAVGTFVADTGFSGGSAGNLPAGTPIDTAGVVSPAPASVYRSWRTGTAQAGFNYTVANLAPGSSYRIRLHFLEPEWVATGKRQFNVGINGQAALRAFDIFQAAGKVKNKAVVRQFDATATAAGTITIAYDPVIGNPIANGIEVAPVTALNYNSGFLSTAGLSFNGSAKLAGTGPAAQLTADENDQGGSIFSTSKVSVSAFHTAFRFQLLNAAADGFTFTIQGNDPTVVGFKGGGLGFESIPKSVGLKFDLWDNAGEGPNSIGLFLNGAAPHNPATDLSASGIDLHSGHPFTATLDYNGKNLTLSLQDMTTKARFSTSYAVNIPATVGGTTAYVGFTGATGGAGVVQNITNWNYTSN